MVNPHQTLAARIVLSTAAAIVSTLVVSNRRLQQLDLHRFERIVNIGFIASRLALFVLVFFVLRLAPRGDVPVYYFSQAAATLTGSLPYRDFVSSYAPLHPYMDALALRLWLDPRAIILMSICVECVALPLWFRAGRDFLSEAEMRTGAVLYVTSAFSLQFVTIDGQDNIIIGVLLAAAILLVSRNRALLSGVLVGAAVAAIKFLPLIYGPVFFVSIRKRWAWLFGMIAVVGVVYGGFAMLRLPLLQPLHEEGAMRSPSNLPFVWEAVSGIYLPSAVYDGLLLMAFAALFGLLAYSALGAANSVRLRGLTFGLVAATMMLEMFAKKSWPAYVLLILFPMCTLIRVERKRQKIAFAFLTVIAVVEHSVWAGYLDSVPVGPFHQHLMAFQPGSVVYLVIEILLMAFYGWILTASVREIWRLREIPASTLSVQPAGLRG